MMTARPTGAIVCAGRIYCDLVFSGLPAMPRLGAEVFAEAMTPVLGGGAFIAAAHLVAHGRPAGVLSRFGTDPISVALEGQFAADGVAMDLIERAADAGPQITIVMAHDSDRAFLSRRAGHALPRDYARLLASSGAVHLHIAEYATFAEHPDLVADAKRLGLTVSLDPSWDEELIHDPSLLSRCAGVDVFLPNLDEALAITGETQASAALAHLARHFPVVAIKLGADGAMLAIKDQRLAQPAPRVPVRDTTGAGDAFNAGLLHAWLEGHAPQRCLQAGIASGSLSVQAIGGTTSLARPIGATG
ncbi:carbohydrate kinase family protein [Devosia alba]|uniref:carbohydrate kinase family protein n=1 Tax=Devosia alba TaxID=3152360 RepID=UPI00326574C9